MLSQVRQFPTLGVDGVFSFLVADSAVSQYASGLTAKKVAYQNLSNRLPWFAPNDPKFDGRFIGTFGGAFAEEGYVNAKTLFERGGGEGECILLHGVKGGLSSNSREYGLRLALKDFPGVKIVATAYTNFDTTAAQKAMSALLPAHKNVKFVFALNDGIAVGALAAMKAAKNTKTLINGFDGDEAFLKQMASDERVVCTTAGLIAFSGTLAAVRLYDYLNGVKLHPLETFIDTESLVIDTPEAATALLDIAAADKPLPWSATKMSRHLNGDKWEIPHKIAVTDPSALEWPTIQKKAKPAGFSFPAEYQSALDGGELDKVNADWEKRTKDPYGPVRDAAKTKEGVLGTFKRLGIA